MKKINVILILVLIITSFNGMIVFNTVYAQNKKPTLSDKKIQINAGKTKTIKLKNVTKKVKWKVSNKKVVKITKKSGKKNNQIKIKGIKAGKTEITATCNKKKYVTKVTVKKKSEGKNNKKTTTEIVTTQPVETSNKEESIPKNNDIQSNVKISGKILNDKIAMDDLLEIEIQIFGKNNNESTFFEFKPGELETFINKKWEKLPYVENINTINYPNFVGEIQGSGKGILTVNLRKYYAQLRTGHYRYTHKVAGQDIVVEFDMYPAGTKIVGFLENDRITSKDNLEIDFYIVGNTAGNYFYSEKKGILEICENRAWKSLELSDEGAVYPDLDCYIDPIEGGRFSISLAKDYIGVRPGHYRYTHVIANELITVEFDVYSEETEGDISTISDVGF